MRRHAPGQHARSRALGDHRRGRRRRRHAADHGPDRREGPRASARRRSPRSARWPASWASALADVPAAAKQTGAARPRPEEGPVRRRQAARRAAGNRQSQRATPDAAQIKSALRDAARALNVAPFDAPARVAAMLAEVEDLKRQLASRAASGALSADALLAKAEKIGGATVVVAEAPGANANLMRQLIDQIRKKTSPTPIFLADDRRRRTKSSSSPASRATWSRKASAPATGSATWPPSSAAAAAASPTSPRPAASSPKSCPRRSPKPGRSRRRCLAFSYCDLCCTYFGSIFASSSAWPRRCGGSAPRCGGGDEEPQAGFFLFHGRIEDRLHVDAALEHGPREHAGRAASCR